MRSILSQGSQGTQGEDGEEKAGKEEEEEEEEEKEEEEEDEDGSLPDVVPGSAWGRGSRVYSVEGETCVTMRSRE